MNEERKSTMQRDEQMIEETPEVREEEAKEAPAIDEVAELKVQVEEYKDRYLRSCAEMDNMKKRLARDKQDIVKYGTEKLLKEVLLVYDAVEKSLHTAIERHPEDEQFIQGLKMTEKLFLETLKKNQVEPIKTHDVPFDPRYHEAMMQEQKDGVPKGMVIRELEKGFMVHERVLRPAKVTVSS